MEGDGRLFWRMGWFYDICNPCHLYAQTLQKQEAQPPKSSPKGGVGWGWAGMVGVWTRGAEGGLGGWVVGGCGSGGGGGMAGEPHKTDASPTARRHHTPATPLHSTTPPVHSPLHRGGNFLIMERDSAKTPTQHRFSQNFTDLHVKTCEDL